MGDHQKSLKIGKNSRNIVSELCVVKKSRNSGAFLKLVTVDLFSGSDLKYRLFIRGEDARRNEIPRHSMRCLIFIWSSHQKCWNISSLL